MGFLLWNFHTEFLVENFRKGSSDVNFQRPRSQTDYFNFIIMVYFQKFAVTFFPHYEDKKQHVYGYIFFLCAPHFKV